MNGKFVIRDNNQLITYTRYEDIPDVFDNVIEFAPDYPEGPHSEEEHEYMDTFNDRLQDLMKRERKYAGSN